MNRRQQLENSRRVSSRVLLVVVTAFVFLLGNARVTLAQEQQVGPDPILLWPDGAPGAVGNEPQDQPELRVYVPSEKPTGTGVVICSGGAYAVLASDHEGHQVARWFNSLGVTAAVLKYRLGPRYHHSAPLQDVQRAIRYLRANAERMGLSPDRIGVTGFSAGGHLASTAATHFDQGHSNHEDPWERVSCRPDFAVLCYAVTSMRETQGHGYSRKMLLGDEPDEKLVALLSNDEQVTGETPPTFLFHTGEDSGVPAENSIAFYSALRRAGVPAELHIYQRGPHGVGLAPGDPILSGWKDRLADWLRSAGFLADVQRAAVRGSARVGGKPIRWGAIAFLPEGEAAGNKPSAWTLINQGTFEISERTGPVTGSHRVEIHDLGSVEPKPTLADSVLLQSKTVEIAAGANSLDFEIEAQ